MSTSFLLLPVLESRRLYNSESGSYVALFPGHSLLLTLIIQMQRESLGDVVMCCNIRLTDSRHMGCITRYLLPVAHMHAHCTSLYV